MSQPQLALVYKNSKRTSRNETISSVRCRMLRARLTRSSLQRKIEQLEERSQAAAAHVEELVDGILRRLALVRDDL